VTGKTGGKSARQILSWPIDPTGKAGPRGAEGAWNMELLRLIGIVIVIAGFLLGFNPLLVVPAWRRTSPR